MPRIGLGKGVGALGDLVARKNGRAFIALQGLERAGQEAIDGRQEGTLSRPGEAVETDAPGQRSRDSPRTR